MLSLAPAWSAALWGRTQQALRAASADLTLAHDRQLLYQVSEALQQRRPQLEADFTRHLQASARPPEPTSAKAQPVDFDQLTLVDEGQAEREIEVSRTVQWIDLQAEWELREMQAFAAMLPGAAGPLDGHRQTADQQQPFRPATFARALADTVRGLQLEDGERQMMLRLAGKALAGLLKEVYAQECQRLRQAGVAPRSYQAPSHPRPSASAASSGIDATRPGALSELVRQHPELSQQARSPSAGEAPAPRPADGGLELDLGAMQRTLQRGLNEAGATAPTRPGVVNLDGGQAAALIGHLWSAMGRDAQVQAPVRALIGHLQEAAAHLARQQPQVIDDPHHPMWRLLEHLAATAAGFGHSEDRDFKAFLAHIGPRIARVAGMRPPRPADFSDTLQQSEAFLQQQGHAALHAAAQPVHAQVQALHTDDRRQALRPLLAQQVEQQMALQLGPLLRERLGKGPDGQTVRKKPKLPASIPQFLLGPWVDALTQAMSDEDADSRMQGLLATTEALMQSLQPPSSEVEQQALREGLPSLVSQVQEALNQAQVPEAQQTAALDALMVVHTQYLRMPPKLRKPGAEDDPGDEPLAPAMHERPWGVDTDIGMLPTVPMALMPDGQSPAQAAIDWLDSLQAGAWLKLQLQSQWHTCRVLWVSEHRAYLVVKDRQHGHLHSLTQGALRKLHEAGLATGLQERSLMQRTVDSLLQDLDAPRH
jgi:hypothetical protein